MISVADLGISNLGSLLSALRRVGVDHRIVRHADELDSRDVVVLPGVGAFADGMAALRAAGMVDALRAGVERDGFQVVGICLGMQLLGDESEEHGRHEGLGLVPGRVVRLTAGGAGLRVPNIGWCDLAVKGDSVPAELDGRAFYFVHSYHLRCSEEDDVVATIDFGGTPVAAVVRRGPVYGMQFHPEKSQDAGLELLSRVLEEAARRSAPEEAR